MTLSRDLNQKENLDFLTAANRNIVILFVVAFPLLICIIIGLRPMTVKIREENSRTVKMLLLLPIDVIDSVPVIQEFLSNGFAQTDTTIKDALLESQERNRSILEASADAILVMNEEGVVESFNTSAETLFGFVVRYQFVFVFIYYCYY